MTPALGDPDKGSLAKEVYGPLRCPDDVKNA